MTVALFLLILLAVGLTGYALMVGLGFDDVEAAGGSVVAGLIGVVLPAWWVGSLGGAFWPLAAGILVAAGGLWGGLTLRSRRPGIRRMLPLLLTVAAVTMVVLFIRLPHPQIEQQEKLMDQGILATLLRARSFPPPDMWLAGETLPYYYLGALLWAVPLRLSGIPLEIGYNLVVALVAGAAASALWVLGRRLSGSPSGGLLAAGVALLAGTPDALRQVLVGRPVWALDYWASSRQVPDTITEYPLFTLWLGDLHPHLLSIAPAALAMLLATEAGRRGPGWRLAGAVAVCVGVTWAANPWAMPPTLVAAGLLMLCGDGVFHRPDREGWRRWGAVAAVAGGAWISTAPFHLGFSPPFQGIGLVRAWTRPLDLLLYAGVLVVPATAVAIRLARRRFEDRGPVVSLAATVAVSAGVVVLAAASGRPTLVLVAAPLLVLAAEVLRDGHGARRPAMALAALGLFMFAVPEVVYVVDSYGDALHRMNTVFKAYIQGWILLALALPALLEASSGSARGRRGWLVAALVLSSLHPASMLLGPLRSGPLGLDGLRWMAPEDRALVASLRSQPPGTTMIEAVGPAYGRHGRLSSASGVPAYLGWANHELVWRGAEVSPETARRDELVRKLYRSTDPEEVHRLVMAAGVDLVAVGSLERLEASAESIEAIRRSGEVLMDDDGALLVRYPAAAEDERGDTG